MKTIFINIASYRDPECQWTVKDLFEKAKYPDRIFVGICWQFIPELDDHLFNIQLRPDQVRTIGYNAKTSRGACWARNEAEKLYKDENYYFQIDSHCRFVQDWDVKIEEMYKKCKSDKAVLSSFPPAYKPPNEILSSDVSVSCAREFTLNKILDVVANAHNPKDAPKEPNMHPFISGGFIFADAKMIKDVSYDPHIYFQGEEINFATRLWTHGWDIFAINEVILFHNYSDTIKERSRHWDDNKYWGKINNISLNRVLHLLGSTPTNDINALKDIEKYNIGTVRTLEEYEDFAGVNFKDCKITKKFNLQKWLKEGWQASLQPISDSN